MKKFDLKELYQKEIQDHIESTRLFLEDNFNSFKIFFDLCTTSIKKGNKIKCMCRRTVCPVLLMRTVCSVCVWLSVCGPHTVPPTRANTL